MLSENTGTTYILNAAKIWQVIVRETTLQLNKVFFEKTFLLLIAFDSQTVWAE